MPNAIAVLEKPLDGPASPEKRVRDRAGTERAILDAAKRLLAEEGFQNFGINAVARGAG
jgi:AcrR family transcriptional regulator